MGEMDEEVDESQGQASERSPLREIPEEELQKSLERQARTAPSSERDKLLFRSYKIAGMWKGISHALFMLTGESDD